jgi:hypothetical protein
MTKVLRDATFNHPPAGPHVIRLFEASLRRARKNLRKSRFKAQIRR